MSVQQLIVSFVALVAIMSAAVPLAKLVRLPAATVQFLLGIGATAVYVGAGGDTGLRYQAFHDLVFMLLVPVLVFEAARGVDWPALRRRLPVVLLLAVVGLIVTTSLVAAGVYLGINHPTGFPVAAALLTGVLLGATDTAASGAAFEPGARPDAHTPGAGDAGPAGPDRFPNPRALLEGESLFNDATAVALFSIVMALALAGGGAVSHSQLVTDGLLLFAREFAGGLLLGGVLGAAAAPVLARLTDPTRRHWLSLLVAFGGYHLGLALHVSGVMVCLATGLWLAARLRDDDTFWPTLGATATGVLFVLMGVTVTWSMFTERWLAMLIAIAAVLVGRLASVAFTLQLARPWLPRPATLREHLTVTTLGLRGGITLALALIVPTELPYWWTIQSIAYGVVLFDLLLIAPLAPVILRRST